MTIAGHDVDPARRGLIECALAVAVLGLTLLARSLWRLGDRLSA